MNKFSIFVFLITALPLFGQNSSFTIQKELNWAGQPTAMFAPGGETLEIWEFDNCSHSGAAPTLPLFNQRFPLTSNATLSVRVDNAVWEPVTLVDHPDNAVIGSDLQPNTSVEQERLSFFGRVTMIPLRRTASGSFERAKSFSLTVTVNPLPTTPPLTTTVSERGADNSKLSNGDIYKFGVNQTAVYKLDFTFLQKTLGISNLDQIDPRKIQILGNGGAMLPELNSTARPDDLLENAVFISGEGDGKFDQGDYILFYASGPVALVPQNLQTATPRIAQVQNLYDRFAWYFVKIGSENGLRIADQAEVAGVAETDQFDEVARIEEERYNLLDWSLVHQGSGKRWYGDLFEQTRSREYKLSFPNIVAEQSAVRMEFAGRCDGTIMTVKLTCDGATFSSTMTGTDNDNNNAFVASNTTINGTFTPDNDDVDLKVDFLNTAKPSQGWLDYIEVNARRRLVMSGKMMSFRDMRTRNNTSTTFRLSGLDGSSLNIWDVTQANVPYRQAYTGGGNAVSFGANTENVVRNYIAFYDNAGFPTPETAVGKIANQNVHALAAEDMIIIYPSEFESAVQQLAQHRRDFSGLKVGTVLMHELFNEYSSGGKDPVAIRDFARAMFEKNPNGFRYLLLFGDGSFDPKNNTKLETNVDFVPVWETSESLSPIEAHPSDDFFALLSPNEDGNMKGAMEVAIGRIPAAGPEDAQAVVNKIINYDKSPESLGDWHNRLAYVADDQESNHVDQAEVLSTVSLQTESWFNADKIYFDAYQRVSSSSEKRIPDAKAAITANMFKGALTFNYIGHGGPKGWGQERVLDIPDIQGWENQFKQTLFITATCSFGGFDDFEFVTGGELALLQPTGGGMGLFTTVRPVYIGANDALTNSVQQFIFKHENYGYRTIGEILKDAKNTLSSSVEDNARRFLLFGDPAQKLAMPEYRVQTDSINGRAVQINQPDTLRSLQQGIIKGSVTDTSGNLLSNFNGRVFVTIFDKAQQLQTLGENGSPVRSYSVQKNVLFRGSATVANGKFTVKFVVPKDINYAFGLGKISYYAENGTPIDAAGGDRTHLVIGGTSKDIQDNTPPVVQVFMNTDAFVSGGVTSNDPKILVKCVDDNGMNVSGTSLGHDLVAVIDDNVVASIVLNEFYESALDNPKEGKALYPLRNLSSGKHTLKVKGWDIANNPGEGYTEFVVTEDGKAALEHVLNYPNPFTTNTSFQFEHNLAGQVLDVQISIFSVSGKLVKTIQHTSNPESFRVTDINWDGRDEYGDQLAKGVYVYRIKVRGTDLTGLQVTAESDYEKLVILK